MEEFHTAPQQKITLFRAIQANGNRSAPTTLEKAQSIAREMEAPHIVNRMHGRGVDPSYRCYVQPIDCTMTEFNRFVGFPFAH